jgi:hypothetical protein
MVIKQILEDSLNDKEKILFGKTYNYQYSLLNQRLMRTLITLSNWLFMPKQREILGHFKMLI